MKRLLSEINGGIPLDWNDIRWLENALIEVVSELAKGMSGSVTTGMKLWGAAVNSNGNNYDVSEGAIYLNGEIFRVPAHTLTKLSGAGTYYWNIEETYDPAGLEQLQNGETADTYAIRQLKLAKTLTVLDPGTFTPLELPSITDVWHPKTPVSNDYTENTAAKLASIKAVAEAYSALSSNISNKVSFFNYNAEAISELNPNSIYKLTNAQINQTHNNVSGLFYYDGTTFNDLIGTNHITPS